MNQHDYVQAKARLGTLKMLAVSLAEAGAQ